MNTKIFIGTVLLVGTLALFCTPLYAQSVPKRQYDDVVFYFPSGGSTFDINYQSNKSSVEAVGHLFLADNLFRIKRLVVVGSVSADGRANVNLAYRRASSVADAILEKYPWVFVDNRMPIAIETISVKTSIQDGATSFLSSATLYAIYEDQTSVNALLLADQSPRMQVQHAKPEKWIEPAKLIEPAKVEPVKWPVGKRTNSIKDSNKNYKSYDYQRRYSYAFRPKVALKTNMLFDLALAANLEAELLIADRWSISASALFPKWHFNNKYCLYLTEVAMEIRHWFGDEHFSGHFLGVYGNWLAEYDLQWDRNGVMGRGFGAGITYGYAHRIAPNLGLEYSVGVGAIYSNNKSFAVADGYDYKLLKSTSDRWSVLPTRLKISLVWRIAGNK